MMLKVLALAMLASSPGTSACECVDALDRVATAVAENYPGYAVKLPTAHDREIHQRFLQLARTDARGLEPAACRRAINRYLDFFREDQLLVGPPTVADEEEAGSTPATPATVGTVGIETPEIPNLAARWTPDKVEFRLRREANLDPIEGLWKNNGGDFAIVYDDAIPRGEYVAFRFMRKYRIRPGEVIAFIRPNGDGSYTVRFKAGEDDWRRATASLTAEGVLTFADRGWQRTTAPATKVGEQPDPFADEDGESAEENVSTSTDLDDALAPQYRDLGSGVAYLKLASFLPRYRESLQELLDEHGERLAGADGLVIDVRGNAGGSSMHSLLADWLYTRPVTQHPASATLASDWNIAHLESRRDALDPDGAWLDAALERLRARRGEIVPLRDATPLETTSSRPGPREIVILQDGGSSGETERFLLQARQGERVVTMGMPSKGNVDYREVANRTIDCGEHSLDLSWPVIMHHRDLPEAGHDDSGVMPDVMLGDGDWLQQATRWLRAGK